MHHAFNFLIYNLFFSKSREEKFSTEHGHNCVHSAINNTSLHFYKRLKYTNLVLGALILFILFDADLQHDVRLTHLFTQRTTTQCNSCERDEKLKVHLDH